MCNLSAMIVFEAYYSYLNVLDSCGVFFEEMFLYFPKCFDIVKRASISKKYFISVQKVVCLGRFNCKNTFLDIEKSNSNRSSL